MSVRSHLLVLGIACTLPACSAVVDVAARAAVSAAIELPLRALAGSGPRVAPVERTYLDRATTAGATLLECPTATIQRVREDALLEFSACGRVDVLECEDAPENRVQCRIARPAAPEASRRVREPAADADTNATSTTATATELPAIRVSAYSP